MALALLENLTCLIAPTRETASSSSLSQRVARSILLQILLLLTLGLAPVLARHLGQDTPGAFIRRETGLNVAEALKRTEGSVIRHWFRRALIRIITMLSAATAMTLTYVSFARNGRWRMTTGV